MTTVDGRSIMRWQSTYTYYAGNGVWSPNVTDAQPLTCTVL